MSIGIFYQAPLGRNSIFDLTTLHSSNKSRQEDKLANHLPETRGWEKGQLGKNTSKKDEAGHNYIIYQDAQAKKETNRANVCVSAYML